MMTRKDLQRARIYRDTQLLMDTVIVCHEVSGKRREDDEQLAFLRERCAIQAIGNLLFGFREVEEGNRRVRDLRYRLVNPAFHKYVLHYEDYVMGADKIEVPWWVEMREQLKKPHGQRCFKY